MPHTIEPRGQSVLIVEDDDNTRAALVMLLSQLGYETVPVATVAESLEKLDGQQRAILDLELPDGLGTTVLRRIRNEKRPIRVAIATGVEDPALLAEARQLDVELILRKPIDVHQLVRWLENAGTPRPQPHPLPGNE